MPVTARLSKLFYERMGEQVTNELVDWFNSVDEDYRGQLKTLNELNFSRFDAKLEQRVVELDAKIDQRITGLNAKIDHHVAELHAKIDHHVAELHAKIDKHVAELNAKIDQRFAEMTALLERRLGEQTRWLFVAWATLLIPVIGLWTRR